MLLEGPGVHDKTDNAAALTIAQIVICNAVKNQQRQVRPIPDSELRHNSPNVSVRHHLTQETACLSGSSDSLIDPQQENS